MSNTLSPLGLAAILAVANVTASAANPVETGLTACRAVPANAERLACYDALASDITAAKAPPAAPEPPAAQVASAPTTPAAPASVTLEAAPATPAEAETTGTLAAPDSPERFGIEQVEREAETPDILESRLVGDYTGWTGDTVFELENGQVWRQVQSGSARYRGPANPTVYIRKRAFGSYRLRVEGSNRTIRVERVR
ncbi:MAG: hypothetical protein AAF229_10085 [Pseudomonadota bacterium]